MTETNKLLIVCIAFALLIGMGIGMLIERYYWFELLEGVIP